MQNEDQIYLVHAYLDGELDPANSLATEGRIAADPQLSHELARARAVSTAMRTHVRREEVSENFKRRILAIAPTRLWPRPTWTALAASVLVAVGSTFFAMRMPADNYVRSEIT